LINTSIFSQLENCPTVSDASFTPAEGLTAMVHKNLDVLIHQLISRQYFWHGTTKPWTLSYITWKTTYDYKKLHMTIKQSVRFLLKNQTIVS